MANFLRYLALFLFSSSLFAAEPGEIDLAGWIKNDSGTYTKAFNDSTGTSRVTLNSPPTTLSTTSTALVNTSKGVQSFDITKTADIDVSRIGKAVRGLAVLGGPVGMTLTAATLVCDLTKICNQAGEWLLKVADFSSTPGSYSTCEEALGWTNPGTYFACDAIRDNPGAGSLFWFRSPAVPDVSAGCTIFQTAGYAYPTAAYHCGNPPSTSRPITNADWDAKESLLNDSRFVPELNEKGIALPTSGIPTLSPDQKKRLGVESEPTKDSQGNVTGRQETVTSIEAVDAGTSDKPGKVIIKETVTKIQYDNNNTQVSSNTSTSYSSQPQTENKPQSFEIKFDEVPPAELPTHNVQATFSHTSWGNGSCPPDIPVSLPYSGANFLIPTQPVCSTAEQINPFVLLLASIAGIYIVSGIRGGEK
jgi:hypothetical protein